MQTFVYITNQIILIVCGILYRSARVGKTSLVSRFLGGKFEDSYTPTIEDFHRKLYRIRGEIHQLDILDTSGNHPFPAMRRLSFLTGRCYQTMYWGYYVWNEICVVLYLSKLILRIMDVNWFDYYFKVWRIFLVDLFGLLILSQYSK